MKIKNLLLATFAIIASTITVNAQKTLVDVAVGSKDHTTLVAAVKAADLVATLQSAGPFTVFAPVNAAFGKLPAGTVEYLLKPENKATLAKVLTYHVVSGSFNAAAVVKAITAAKGSLSLTTVSGGILIASSAYSVTGGTWNINIPASAINFNINSLYCSLYPIR